MSSVPLPMPDENDRRAFTPPTRRAHVEVDELGITVRADLRIAGVTKDIADLFCLTPVDAHPDLLERAVVVGATTIAASKELTAVDAARVKLSATADALEVAASRLTAEYERRMAAVEQLVTKTVGDLRSQMIEGRDEERCIRQELREGQAELTKSAKALDVSREQLEKRTAAAVSSMLAAQTKAKDDMLNGTEQTLRKLVDENNPASAPALIKTVVDRAAVDMRQTTNKNVADLVQNLGTLLGEGSPLIDRVAMLVREGAEREIKRLEEQLDRLRADVITSRARDVHDPNVRGDGYEDDVLDLLGAGAAVHGWTVIRTGHQTGDDVDSKKGDHLVLDECDAPVAAIEARARKGVSSRALFEGMHATATNRGVNVVAYFARGTEDLPTGLGEFSRGRMPLHFKRLTDGVQAIVAVVDPTSDRVVERLALILWLIEHLHDRSKTSAVEDDAGARIEQSLPCLAQLEDRLGLFRSVKSGLTKASGEISKTRAKVDEIEIVLREDLGRLQGFLDPSDTTDDGDDLW